MGHGHGARGRSLTLGIRYHGHGCRGNVVESMNVIGHGKESPWGGLVKFFQCAGYIGEINYESRILGMDREGKVQGDV